MVGIEIYTVGKRTVRSYWNAVLLLFYFVPCSWNAIATNSEGRGGLDEESEMEEESTGGRKGEGTKRIRQHSCECAKLQH